MIGDQDLKFSAEYSYRIKTLFLGDRQSGKSSLIYTYKHEGPPMHKIRSTETDAVIKKIKYVKANKDGVETEHYECNIHMWDTTSDESPDVLNTILIKRVNAIILVFDRNSKRSFERMKMIWAKVEEKSRLYHVSTVVIGNVKEKKDMSSYRQRRRAFEEEFHNERTVMLEEESVVNSKHRKSSFNPKNVDASFDQDELSREIKLFTDSEEMDYYEISVHQPEQVRKVFQELLARIMKGLEEGKIHLHDTVIKDSEGKVKLRKYDYKTYEYFEKRYNRCC